MTTTMCDRCKVGATHEEKRPKFGGAARVFGWLLVVGGALGSLIFGILVLGSFAGGEIMKQMASSPEIAEKVRVDVVYRDLQMYRGKHGSLPADLATLARPDPDHGNRPWVEAELLVDPWGHDLVLKKGDSSNDFEVVSYGPHGTADASSSKEWIASSRPLDPQVVVAAAHKTSTDPDAKNNPEAEKIVDVMKVGSSVALVVALGAIVLGIVLVRGKRVRVCEQCGAVADV